MPAQNSPYKYIQCVAYVLNTAPKPATPVPPTNPYYIGLADPDADIAARCALVQRAIATAAASPRIRVGGDTLKIFMIPEFALRGVTGAYQMTQVAQVVQGLKNVVADDRYADWVFVFGSIVGSSASADDADRVVEVYNFSLVQRGGARRTSADANIVMKEFQSNLDFIGNASARATPPAFRINPDYPPPPAGTLLDTDVRHMEAGEPGLGRESQLTNYDGRGIFGCAGIRFGIEICLDHAAQRIVGSPQIPGDQQVQVQLVPSCGMDVRQSSLVGNPNAYAFGCDGAGRGASVVQPQADAELAFALIDVDAQALTPGQVAVSMLYNAAPVPAPDAGQGVRAPGPGSEAGSIVVYDPFDTPPVTLVPGKYKQLTWASGSYQIEFNLLYGADDLYTGASVKVSNPNADLNTLAHLLPTTLAGTDGQQQSGRISFTVNHGGDGYDSNIECDSTLPDFRFSGVVVEFDRQYGGRAPTIVC